ncbi:MAG: adenosylhomocysteinase [Firmicutes bacterium]|nr:adenosylhomocysteinase [Bacillota bacterium]
MHSIIANPELAAAGARKIEWARDHMPVLRGIQARFEKEKPFAGLVLAVSVHLEAKTAYLAQTLTAAGAAVVAMGSNPLSTQDDVCAALSASGVTVFAKHACTMEEYHEFLIKGLESRPHIMIDDGGDMVNILHEERPELAARLIGGCEETTTGVLRLRARERAGTLRFPMLLVNDADSKHLFDNRYGTGQSVWDGIVRTTNLSVAGSTVVVAGYGWCGKGVAMRAKGLGARVIVTEVDPVKAVEAVMDGFTVLPMAQAAPLGNFFITVTGCENVIGERHLPLLKDGAVLCNAGHFDVEVDVAAIRRCAASRFVARHNIEGFVMPGGKTVYLLAEGRLVNLAAADGHPVEIMDMSFALQALCCEWLAQKGSGLSPAAYPVPREADVLVSSLKLAAMGVATDTLTEKQALYLEGWG